MEKIKLNIVGMSYSQSQSGAYALILGIEGKEIRIPIMIGGFEAQAIAIALEKMKPTRPLTHDLFKSFADRYHINLQEVIISKFEEGIFYAKLICEYQGEINEIDSRTSDAIALAIRFNAPIYANESVVDEVGIEMKEDVEQPEEENKQEETTETKVAKYDDYLIEELKDLLQKAIEDENYEEASKIRDEIKKRENVKPD